MEATKTISADDFINQAFESSENRTALKKHIKDRRIVSTLAALRASKGITQTALSEQMQCGQARVSKLESGADADLTMADLEAYAKVTGSEVTILVSDRGKTLADQIKMHAFSIRQAFLKLVELAHSDDMIAKGVAKLHWQAFENINRMLSETASQLPPCAENGKPYIQITSSEEVNKDADQTKASGERRQRKATASARAKKRAQSELQTV